MTREITKQLRLEQIEKWTIQGKTQGEIAQKLGISRETLNRYLSKRKKKLMATLSERQAVMFDFLAKTSLDDLDALGQMIDRMDDGLVTTDAFGKRLQIVRNLANLFGLSSTVKVQNIQNNLHVNKTQNTVSMNGPVQIIVESNGGQFDQSHGTDRVRMGGPSADEISSAVG